MAVEEDAEGVEVEDKEEEWRWEKTGGGGRGVTSITRRHGQRGNRKGGGRGGRGSSQRREVIGEGSGRQVAFHNSSDEMEIKEDDEEAMEDSDEVEEIVDGAEKVWQIMRSVVAPKTALNYCLRNTSFLMYLLDIQNEEDMNGLFEPWFLDVFDGLDEEERKRKAIKDFVFSMESSLDNCPLVLDCLTFKIFSEFIASKKQDGKMMSKSTYEGYKSALRHIYRSSKYEMEAGFEKNLSLFMSGLVRKVSTSI